MSETWKVIPEFPNYEISDLGKVRNHETQRELALRPNQRGVVYVGMQRVPGDQVVRAVAPLVAQAFVTIDNPTWDSVIHLNGSVADNRAVNLAYRQRWFAIQYQRQFLDQPYTRRIYSRIECATCGGLQFEDSFAAAMAHGLMERAVVLNAVGVIDSVAPTWHEFRIADTS